MDNDKLMREAARIAHEMDKILLKKLKNKDVEYAFKFGTWTLPLLIAGFIDAIFKDSHPEQKFDLVNEIAHLSKLHLVTRQKDREGTPTEPH